MDPIEVGIGVSIVIGAFGAFTIVGVAAAALLKRWSRPKPSLDAAETHELRHAITQLAAEVSELHERVDFAERMLTSQREPHRLTERE
ncbi:MAG: hypothetical protein JSW43_03520 [Gemmatimonadota bacterium]|nr:MAG: hypothetical protein JSW43_03520 [Gemmatimonadota bacterium]